MSQQHPRKDQNFPGYNSNLLRRIQHSRTFNADVTSGQLPTRDGVGGQCRECPIGRNTGGHIQTQSGLCHARYDHVIHGIQHYFVPAANEAIHFQSTAEYVRCTRCEDDCCRHYLCIASAEIDVQRRLLPTIDNEASCRADREIARSTHQLITGQAQLPVCPSSLIPEDEVI
ncbi:MAG UNVERIFIED_CONTAM: hypothetical protein LVR18_42840 [Planctomycetaceae bacterium]